MQQREYYFEEDTSLLQQLVCDLAEGSRFWNSFCPHGHQYIS